MVASSFMRIEVPSTKIEPLIVIELLRVSLFNRFTISSKHSGGDGLNRIVGA